MKIFNSEVSAYLESKAVGLFGFADLSCIPSAKRYDFPRSVSFALPLSKKIVEGIGGGPTLEYYREYDRLNTLLLKTGKEIEEYIISLGFKAKTLEATVRKLDNETLATMLPHKTSATLSGLGWIGKSALLVSKKYGTAMRFSTVLTDIPLETGVPVEKAKCGVCVICVTNCPAKAIKGVSWKRGMERAELYDAFACRKKAEELSDAIGVNRTICGICIANCPHTKRYLGRKDE